MEQTSQSGKNVIALVALDKDQLPCVARPCEDRTGRLKTGQGKLGYFENLTKQDKEDLPIIVDRNTEITLEDGKVFDLDNPIDNEHWRWLKEHPYIASKKADIAAKPTARFYVASAQEEAKTYVDKTAKIDRARPAVRQLSVDKMILSAGALGLAGADAFPPEQLLAWLLRKCDTNPQAVLDVIDPNNTAKVKVTDFVNRATRLEIIAREADGVFYFGGAQGVALGHTPDMVVDYLLNPENKERAKAMMAMLNEKTKNMEPVAV